MLKVCILLRSMVHGDVPTRNTEELFQSPSPRSTRTRTPGSTAGKHAGSAALACSVA